jgi:hypothetical protein
MRASSFPSSPCSVLPGRLYTLGTVQETTAAVLDTCYYERETLGDSSEVMAWGESKTGAHGSMRPSRKVLRAFIARSTARYAR